MEDFGVLVNRRTNGRNAHKALPKASPDLSGATFGRARPTSGSTDRTPARVRDALTGPCRPQQPLAKRQQRRPNGLLRQYLPRNTDPTDSRDAFVITDAAPFAMATEARIAKRIRCCSPTSTLERVLDPTALKIQLH